MHLSVLAMAIWSVSSIFISANANSNIDNSVLRANILSHGVPADAYDRLVNFMESNRERKFVIDTYVCADMPDGSLKPCHESKRSRATQTVNFKYPQHVVIVDFSKPSSSRRFHLIDLNTGGVESTYSSHGIGSGDSDWANQFSNIKDSRQTSLGVYYVGGTYFGKYGESLRMYGLEKSNNESYNRDIVMHGAWYAEESFISSINKKTNQEFGRLGVSWGCPAVAKGVMKDLIPLLQNGGLIYHYHSYLADKTNTGDLISAPLRPRPRPKYVEAKRPQIRPADLNVSELEEGTAE